MTDPRDATAPTRPPRPDAARSTGPPTGESTRAIRAASRTPAVKQQPTSVPIFQTATFSSPDAETLGAVTGDAHAGYSYSRLSNPTTTALGDAYAEIAGGEAGVALASGMAAIHAACAAVLRAGDRVVAPLAAFGSTRSQLLHYFGRYGVRVDLVDMTDLEAVQAAIGDAPTRLVYAESSANPTTLVADHPALAELAHRAEAFYIVDNTFASSYICRPLELGADLVIESATKYLGGHSDVIAGVVAGPAPLVDAVAAIRTDTGAVLAPMEAFLVLRGIMTFPTRMERHGRTALALAGWLERQGGVERVLYPGLASHPQHALVERIWRPDNAGGMLSFKVTGGRAAGQAIIDRLAITERTASLGSVHTMVVHPPSTSHRMLGPEELAASGIDPGLLRVSVGLEDIEDLVADFGQALEAARAVAARSGDAEPGATARDADAVGATAGSRAGSDGG